MVARADHKYVKMGWESKLKPTEVLAILPTEAQQLSQQHKSHYREVPRWEIFMEQELRFELDLGQLALLKKKPLVRFWAAFEAVFLSFLGKKEKKINNIVASPLENCIKWS